MSRKILVLASGHTSLTDAVSDVWEWYQLTLFKRDTLEEAIKDLKTDFYLAVIVALNRDNVDEVQHQTKVFQTLTASPLCVIAEEPVDVDIKLDLLNRGTDYFMSPSTSIEEAAAEIMALTRRFTESRNIAFTSETHLYSHGLFLDLNRQTVIVGATEIELKKLEFDILSMLAKGNGRIYSSLQIYEEVWREDSVENAVGLVRSQICRLRKKLQVNPKQPNYIRTHKNSGYSFRPE